MEIKAAACRFAKSFFRVERPILSGGKKARKEHPDEDREEQDGMSSAKEMLVQALADCASQVDQIRMQHATQQLEEWRTQPGFFSTLQVRRWSA